MDTKPKAFVAWLLRFSAVAVALCACCPPARAANNCPWLNEATASGILGGPVSSSYHPAEQSKPAVCTFTQTDAAGTRELVITVEVAESPHERVAALLQACHTASEPLSALGNEAATCHGDGHAEQIIGRVRDQVFVISMRARAEHDPVLNQHELHMRSWTTAEEVSGNLF